MNSATDGIPDDELARQARREAEALQEMAGEARRLTERRNRDAEALRNREAAQLAEREAETYRRAAEIEQRLDEYRRAKDREAEEAQRAAGQQEAAARVRAQEGEIADASGRYAQALGQHYDIADPYRSLARAAMAEYGAFHREQDRLRREIAAETNAEKRQLLELRKEIEAADYMAITSERLAGIGRVVAGRDDSPQVRQDEVRHDEFTARSQELRERYRELLEVRLTRAPDGQDLRSEPVRANEHQGQPSTEPTPEIQRSSGRAASRSLQTTQQGDQGGEPRVIAGVLRDPRRERRQQEDDVRRRGRDDPHGTQAAAPASTDGEPARPSAAALARIRKQRERYDAIDAKRTQARQTGRTRGGPSR